MPEFCNFRNCYHNVVGVFVVARRSTLEVQLLPEVYVKCDELVILNPAKLTGKGSGSVHSSSGSVTCSSYTRIVPLYTDIKKLLEGQEKVYVIVLSDTTLCITLF